MSDFIANKGRRQLVRDTLRDACIMSQGITEFFITIESDGGDFCLKELYINHSNISDPLIFSYMTRLYVDNILLLEDTAQRVFLYNQWTWIRDALPELYERGICGKQVRLTYTTSGSYEEAY